MRHRPAVRADIPALVALTRRCDLSHRDWAGPALAIPGVEEESLSWEVRFSLAMAWIAVAEDEAAGIVATTAYGRARGGPDDRTPLPHVAHVSAVFVDPDHWRRGIARALLADAESAMRTAGFTSARLETLEGSPAEAFYAALGWRRDGRRDHFAAMGIDTVGYAKALV